MRKIEKGYVRVQLTSKVLRLVERESKKGNTYVIASYFWGDNVETDMVEENIVDMLSDAYCEGKDCLMTIEIERGRYPRYTIVNAEVIK